MPVHPWLFQSTCQVVGFMFPPEILPVGLMCLPITLILTICGENAFMVRILIPARNKRSHCFRSGTVLYVSNLPRILITVLISLLSYLYSAIQVAHENIRMWCHGVSQWGYGLLNSIHITLPSRQCHTHSTHCFLTHLPSKALLRCPWIRTRISLYQHHDYVCWVVSTGCPFQGTYAALTFAQCRPDAYWALIVPTFPSYLRRCNTTIPDARLIFLGLPGYLSPPHRLSRCHRSRYNPNFAAIRVREGPY